MSRLDFLLSGSCSFKRALAIGTQKAFDTCGCAAASQNGKVRVGSFCFVALFLHQFCTSELKGPKPNNILEC